MPFEDCICFRLGKALRKVSRAYREEIAAHGLTHGQFFMLVAIMEEEGLLPSALADKTAQDRATTTGLLDRLERDGWVERRADHRDRRSLRIYLTPQGRARREAILALFESTNRAYRARFEAQEWAQMQALLARLEQ